jgi:hypothetical protein
LKFQEIHERLKTRRNADFLYVFSLRTSTKILLKPQYYGDKKAKPKKSYKLSDGGGMYLEVMPNGSKYWRMKYRFGGKKNVLPLVVTL